MSLFKVGDRVRLNPMCDFYLSLTGSGKDEVGVVVDVSERTYPYFVDWPHSALIPHYEKELIPADVPTPSEKEMEELL